MVINLTFLATTEGQLVFPGSDEFLESLGDPDPDYDAAEFAIRNLGFVELQTVPPSTMKIRLHPRNAERQAVRKIEQVILESVAARFVIEHLDREWQSVTLSSGEAAIARIGELRLAAYAASISWDRLTRFSPKP
jgi:hypothetical protein